MSIYDVTIQKNLNRRRRPLTPWELPELLNPMHQYRRSTLVLAKERAHYAAVLIFIYRNRFAVSSQVQRRFSKWLRSDRTARRHLAEMEALGYLGVAPTRSTSPLWPKVYFVTARGVRKIRRELAARQKSATIGRVDVTLRRGYSADHVLHEVLTTEFLLAVWQTVQGRPDLELLTVQRRSLERHPSFLPGSAGRTGRLKPDAMFVFGQQPGMMCCFVEVDAGTMSPRQIAEKYQRYEAWSRSFKGQHYLTAVYARFGASEPNPIFRVLVIAQDRAGVDDNRRLMTVCQLARKLPAALQQRLWFTTVSNLRAQQHSMLPLGGEVWWRGRDLSKLTSFW